jgi:DNA-binding NtrC family response regulator
VSARVLLVDDDGNLRRVLAHHLQTAGYDVTAKADGREALAALQGVEVDLLLTDVRMPGMDGMALLRQVRRQAPDLPVLVMTAYGTIQDAVDAMKEGAFDYLTKPVERDTLLRAVQKGLQFGDLRRENRRLRASLAEQHPLDTILGTSIAMEGVRELVRKAGPTEATVLITGESGTGKELVAKALHALSQRAAGPFVALNCAALSAELLESELFGHVRGAFTGAVADHPGKFRQAQGGTLFLDEIGDMDPRLQAKILRALQERVVDPLGSTKPVPVNVRLLAASNRDLKDAAADGTFREDLYYRLAVLTVSLPPLRDREGDALLLMKHFCRLETGGELDLAPESVRVIEAYGWPGNVRELANLCQKLAILYPRQRITPEMLPSEINGSGVVRTGSGEPGAGLWDQERAAIIRALHEHGGNRSAAARALKVPRHILLYRLKKYGLEEE